MCKNCLNNPQICTKLTKIHDTDRAENQLFTPEFAFFCAERRTSGQAGGRRLGEGIGGGGGGGPNRTPSDSSDLSDPIGQIGPIRPGRLTGLGWPAGRVRWSPICPTSPMGPMGPMGPMWSDWARRPVNFCKQTLHIPKTTAPSGRPLRSHGPAPGQAARETPGGSAESQHIHNQSSRSLRPSHPDDGENSPR